MKPKFCAAALCGIILITALLPACGNGVSLTSSLTAREIIDRSCIEMEEVNSFGFDLTHDGGGTPIIIGLDMTQAAGMIVKPDRLQATVSATMLGMFFEFEVITIGEATYITNPLSKEKEWQPLSSDFKGVELFDPDAGVIAIMKGLADVSRLDDEKAAGVNCYKLKGSIDSGTLISIFGSTVLEGVAIAIEVWIGSEDLLVHQITFEGQITESEEPGIIRTLKLSDFDKPVTIEIPQL
ncbi:LppX_LprAFG lipoprotein [Chloroflexota bacterium]